MATQPQVSTMSLFSDSIKQRATMLSEMVLDEDVGQISDSDTPPEVEQMTEEEISDDVGNDIKEISDTTDTLGAATHAQVTLESLQSILSKSMTNGGMTPIEVESFALCNHLIARQLGTEIPSVPDMQSFGTMGAEQYTQLAFSQTKDAKKGLWEYIKGLWAKIVAFVQRVWVKLTGGWEKLLKRVQDQIETVKRIENGLAKGEIGSFTRDSNHTDVHYHRGPIFSLRNSSIDGVIGPQSTSGNFIENQMRRFNWHRLGRRLFSSGTAHVSQLLNEYTERQKATMMVLDDFVKKNPLDAALESDTDYEHKLNQTYQRIIEQINEHLKHMPETAPQLVRYSGRRGINVFKFVVNPLKSLPDDVKSVRITRLNNRQLMDVLMIMHRYCLMMVGMTKTFKNTPEKYQKTIEDFLNGSDMSAAGMVLKYRADAARYSYVSDDTNSLSNKKDRLIQHVFAYSTIYTAYSQMNHWSYGYCRSVCDYVDACLHMQ